jgi:hypothetical protein
MAAIPPNPLYGKSTRFSQSALQPGKEIPAKKLFRRAFVVSMQQLAKAAEIL